MLESTNRYGLNMKKKVLLGLVLCLGLLNACVTVPKDGKPKEVNPQTENQQELSRALNELKGEYAGIDFEKTEQTIKSVSAGDMNVIKDVMNDPNKYVPPVLLAYAEQVFQAGHPEVAMFWYYTAQLRARSDANKSLDKSVQRGVTALSVRFGTNIGTYAEQHLDQLELVMQKVLSWDEQSERNYNPKWVALLGEEAKFSQKVRFVDASKYKQVDEETRRGWKIGFDSAIRQLREEVANNKTED